MADRLVFAYSTSANARGELGMRPYLPLTLTHDLHSSTVVGLVDSGADISVLPYAVGLALGMNWAEQPRLVSLSGNLAHYETRSVFLDATIGSLAPVSLVFAWTRAENVPLILGQVNFFQTFDVCFFRSRRAFELELRGEQ